MFCPIRVIVAVHWFVSVANVILWFCSVFGGFVHKPYCSGASYTYPIQTVTSKFTIPHEYLSLFTVCYS